jgi:hypothetical protein
MTYTDRPDRIDMAVPPHTTTTNAPLVEYHDRVRWGPIFAGIVVAVISQLLLSSLGAVVGGFAAGDATARSIGTGIGIWAVISLLISLFLGGYVMSSACGPMNNKTAMLNGVILWATTLVISGWLLASGVSGTFGLLAANAGDVLGQVAAPGGAPLPDSADVTQAIPDVSAEEAAQYAADASRAALYFIIGSLIGLAACLIGATVGSKKPRAVVR